MNSAVTETAGNGQAVGGDGSIIVFSVFGYSGCGYANNACERVQSLSQKYPGKFKSVCKITSRSEYQNWLRSRIGLAANVGSHRTSPACFEDSKFIGGCDELTKYLGSKSFADRSNIPPQEGSGCLLL
eukprot:Stramenopile-MAST_4_protein_228